MVHNICGLSDLACKQVNRFFLLLEFLTTLMSANTILSNLMSEEKNVNQGDLVTMESHQDDQ